MFKFVVMFDCEVEFIGDVNGNLYLSVIGYFYVQFVFDVYLFDELFCNIFVDYEDSDCEDICVGIYSFEWIWIIMDFCILDFVWIFV